MIEQEPEILNIGNNSFSPNGKINYMQSVAFWKLVDKDDQIKKNSG